MSRQKIYADASARKRAHRLRKRLKVLNQSFLGSALIGFYGTIGHDVGEVSTLPEIRFDDFYQWLRSGLTKNEILQQLMEMPLIAVDRSRVGDPQIQILPATGKDGGNLVLDNNQESTPGPFEGVLQTFCDRIEDLKILVGGGEIL